MKILITGASGFIGKHLSSSFASEHDITVLGRNIDTLKRLFPHQRAIDWQALDTESATDYQMLINLCGENIADKRWTHDRKNKILQSRVSTAEKLCNWALSSKRPESFRFLNASAVGIYGLNTTDNTETTLIKRQQDCFSQAVVFDWEAKVREKLDNKINYTLARFGVVLKKQEGMLKKLETPYKLGLASVLGNGEQAISWVHIDDLINAIRFIIENPALSGPVNIVAPEITTQKQLAKTLAKALHRPCLMRTPGFLIKLLFGQMGEELLLSGQAVIAKRLKDAGFSFRYPTLAKAIFHEYQ